MREEDDPKTKVTEGDEAVDLEKITTLQDEFDNIKKDFVELKEVV